MCRDYYIDNVVPGNIYSNVVPGNIDKVVQGNIDNVVPGNTYSNVVPGNIDNVVPGNIYSNNTGMREEFLP